MASIIDTFITVDMHSSIPISWPAIHVDFALSSREEYLPRVLGEEIVQCSPGGWCQPVQGPITDSSTIQIKTVVDVTYIPPWIHFKNLQMTSCILFVVRLHKPNYGMAK